MKLRFLAVISILILTSASFLFSEEKKADGTAPKLIRGFQLLSDKELEDGWLLLFDGKTFFGWEAKPMQDRRPLGIPDPKICIARGVMKIETEIPIRIKTPLAPVRPWVLEIRYRTEGDFAGKLFAGVPVLENGQKISRIAEIPLAESADSALITVEAPSETQNSDVIVNGKETQLGSPLLEKGIEFVIDRGTLFIETVRYRQSKTPIFNGTDLSGWKIAGESAVEVADGAVHITGGSGDLESDLVLSDGIVSFEFKENVSPCNSGFFFRSIPGSKMDGYECQMNNAPPEEDRPKFLGNDTGSIFRREVARRVVADPSDWTAVSLMADGPFFRTWVNGIPALVWTDTRDSNENPRKGSRLEAGTIQFQGHDPSTDVTIRRIAAAASSTDEAAAITASAAAQPALSSDNAAFLAFKPCFDQLKADGIELTDFHIHLRGGMTPETALQRQKETGLYPGVLENAGRNWPLADNDTLKAFIDSAEEAAYRDDPSQKSLLVGIQVNDRDWYKALDPELLKRLDFVLADTMIMGTDAEGNPQKLWLLPADYDVDLDVWMEEYMNHYRTILDEPITILANPTYLPLFAEDHYDELWTDERIDEIVSKAVEKGIALEIQAESPFPQDRFIRKALEKGAKLSFGTNNFDSVLKKLDRWEEVFSKYHLKKEDILQREDVLK